VSTQSKSPDRIAKRALVLLSGGLDSTVSLLWAMERFEQVDTVTIDYGENAVELEFRARTLDGLRTRFPQLVARLGDDTVLPLPGLEVLTRLPVAQSVRRHLWSRGLGTEVIIGRNVIFMALANSIAERTGITDFLVGTYGFGDRFREGLPDVIESFEKAYSTLRGTKVTIYRPLEHGGGVVPSRHADELLGMRQRYGLRMGAWLRNMCPMPKSGAYICAVSTAYRRR
jgi:7-cyano-7-deazaguanine synthase in queuosine biosynthesis